MKIAFPNRIVRSYTQALRAAPAQVFPLLCPVREAEWIEDWDPLWVATHSGYAEPDCVFVTHAPKQAVWYVTRHEPHTYVEMLKITPQVTACKLSIRLEPAPHGTSATVTYAHTSLGEEGDAFIAGFTQPSYEQFMRDWEERLNYFLAHGTRRA